MSYEENIRKLFKHIHGALDMDELLPLPKEKADKVVSMTSCMRSELFSYRGSAMWVHRGCVIELEHVLSLEEKVLNTLVPGFDEDKPNYSNMLTRAMQHFREGVDRCIAEGDYCGWFSMMDKRMIIPMLVREVDSIPAEKLYDVFIDVVQRSEYGFEELDPILPKVVAAAEHSEERRKRLRHLRKKKHGNFKIFRGMTEESNPEGISWTTDKAIAERFANRFKQGGWVDEIRIKAEDALDFLTSRGESEVLIVNHKIPKKHEESRSSN